MNLIISAKLDWDFRSLVEKMSPQDRQAIRDNVFALRELDEPEEGKSYWPNIPDPLLITQQEFDYLVQAGAKIEVKRFKNNYTPDNQAGGAHYHYHLPNLSLLLFDEVTWLEDACTQSLQSHLDEGWRMIAVCPPNGARRPDYILGRVKQQ